MRIRAVVGLFESTVNFSRVEILVHTLSKNVLS